MHSNSFQLTYWKIWFAETWRKSLLLTFAQTAKVIVVTGLSCWPHKIDCLPVATLGNHGFTVRLSTAWVTISWWRWTVKSSGFRSVLKNHHYNSLQIELPIFDYLCTRRNLIIRFFAMLVNFYMPLVLVSRILLCRKYFATYLSSFGVLGSKESIKCPHCFLLPITFPGANGNRLIKFKPVAVGSL